MALNLILLSVIKLLIVLVSFLVPYLASKYYAPDVFGRFLYLITLGMFATIFQSGVTASLRDRLVAAESADLASSFYIESLVKTFIYIFFGVLLVLSLSFFLPLVGYSTFLCLSLFSIISPVVSTYFDYREKSVLYRFLEFFSIVITLIVVYFMMVHSVDLEFVAAVWVLNRLWVSFFFINWLSFLRLFINCFYKLSIFLKCLKPDVKDSKYLALQFFSTICVLLLNYLMINNYGDVLYGEINIMQKFIFFPIQVFSFVAPVLWMRYSKDIASENKVDDSVVSFLFYGVTFFWAIFIGLSVESIYSIYLGKAITQGKDYILILVVGFVFLQCKDFLSVKLNAEGLFDWQSIAMIFISLGLLFSWLLRLDVLVMYSCFNGLSLFGIWYMFKKRLKV